MISLVLLIGIYFGIYALLALGQNLITGMTGLLSLCQAAFMAIGAYTTAIILTSHHPLPLAELIVIVVFMGSLFGAMIGLPTLRLKGDYLAIASLGFGEIVKNVLLNADKFTGGPMGITHIPSVQLGRILISPYDKSVYLIFVWGFVGVILWGLFRLQRSRFGRALEAIREDEVAASSLGLNTTLYKVVAFMIGAAISALAGMLWAIYNGSVIPQSFDFMLSIMVLCMVVLGGLGNYFAALVGTMVIVIISELPRLLGFSVLIPAQLDQILFGLILVILMIYRPEGLLGRPVSKRNS